MTESTKLHIHSIIGEYTLGNRIIDFLEANSGLVFAPDRMEDVPGIIYFPGHGFWRIKLQIRRSDSNEMAYCDHNIKRGYTSFPLRIYSVPKKFKPKQICETILSHIIHQLDYFGTFKLSADSFGFGLMIAQISSIIKEDI